MKPTPTKPNVPLFGAKIILRPYLETTNQKPIQMYNYIKIIRKYCGGLDTFQQCEDTVRMSIIYLMNTNPMIR